MKLQSMRRTKKEKKHDTPEVAPMSEEDYPYGLEIRLEEESLEKLGLDVDDFSIDGKVDLICEGEVTNLNISANTNHSHASVSIQITDMAMKQRPKAKRLRDVINSAKDEY